jgi:hypothetical protein
MSVLASLKVLATPANLQFSKRHKDARGYLRWIYDTAEIIRAPPIRQIFCRANPFLVKPEKQFKIKE